MDPGLEVRVSFNLQFVIWNIHKIRIKENEATETILPIERDLQTFALDCWFCHREKWHLCQLRLGNESVLPIDAEELLVIFWRKLIDKVIALFDIAILCVGSEGGWWTGTLAIMKWEI
jgi:hypothetical protein